MVGLFFALTTATLLASCKSTDTGSDTTGTSGATSNGSVSGATTTGSVPAAETGSMDQSSSAPPNNDSSPARMAPESQLYWNLWVEQNSEVVKRIQQGTTADVVLDLSKYAYTDDSAVTPSAALRKLIDDARSTRATVRIVVRANLLGAGGRVSFARGARPTQDVALNFDALEVQDRDAFAIERAQLGLNAPTRLLPRLSQKYSLVRARNGVGVHLPILVSQGAPGRFQVMFTIWDEQDSRPLDHLVFTVMTDQDNASDDHDVPRIQGGFGALGGAMSSRGSSKAAASFYVFEYLDTSNTIQTKAIYVAMPSAANGSAVPQVYAWSIDGSLAAYLNGDDIVRAVLAARSNKDGGPRYRELARDLHDKLFPYDRYDSDRNAERAFDDLTNLGRNGRQPLVLMRHLSSEGKHVYAPLGVLNSLPDVKRHFKVSYPLPREDYGTNQCIGRVSFAYPERITGQDSPNSLEWDTTIMSKLPKDRYVRLESTAKLRCYLNYEGEGCEPERSQDQQKPAEALVLLAHHSNGFLWYLEEKDRKLDEVAVDREQRVFPAGSAAFLNACSTLNSSRDGNRLVIRLNEFGVDAIVASPFPVDLDYGILLSRNLNIVIAEAVAAHERPSVQEIFDRAVDQIRSSTDAGTYGEMDQEFLILGNRDITICP
jgi:hypothetical protein